MSTIDRAELLALIEAELQDEERSHSRRGAGRWALVVGVGATGWLLLESLVPTPHLSLLAAIVAGVSLLIELTRRLVRPRNPRNPISGERYVSSKTLRGDLPSALAETVRFAGLTAVAVASSGTVGPAVAAAAAAYFGIMAAVEGAGMSLARMEIPLPQWDYPVGNRLRAFFFAIHGLGMMSVTLYAVAMVPELLTSVPLVKMGVLLSALTLMLVLLAREYDESAATAALVDIRRAVVLNAMPIDEARGRLEEALVGLTPRHLALPTGSDLFGTLDSIGKQSASLLAGLPDGAPVPPDVLVELNEMTVRVNAINASLSTQFRQLMWAFSAGQELGIGMMVLAKRLREEVGEANRNLDALRTAVNQRFAVSEQRHGR